MPETEGAVKGALLSAEAAVEHELVVVESFLDHVKGEVIADAEMVRDLLASEWEHHVVKRIAAA